MTKTTAPAADLAKMPTFSTELPDYLKGKEGIRGSEEVTHEDMTIPRLEVIQSLSKARKRGDPNFIEGAEEGMLYNSVTRELYGFEAIIVPIMFIKEHLLWRDQALGGGFAGAFAEEIEAKEAMGLTEKPEEWEAVLTHQHFCLILKTDGTYEEAVISMSKSKLKVSKKFNSLVRVNGGDRFSRVYKVAGIADQNAKGQDFFNLSVTSLGYAPKHIYEAAEGVYELIRSGKVTADRGQEVSDEDCETGEKQF